uniref:Uncharacterized protein n=1 Tax=Octactis speculum TaxID=3111310 RepID=A0A7S2B002_9STRA
MESSISGVSLRKTLNRLANAVLQVALVGSPADVLMLSSQQFVLPDRLKEDWSPANPADEDSETAQELARGLVFMNCIFSLLSGVESTMVEQLTKDADDLSKKGDDLYLVPYKRLKRILNENGCVIQAATARTPPSAEKAVLRPRDRNICLSLKDLMRFQRRDAILDLAMESNDQYGRPHEARFDCDVIPETTTEALNQVSNVVERSLTFGSVEDVSQLSRKMSDDMSDEDKFSLQWTTSHNGVKDPDAEAYWRALRQLLTEGLDVDYSNLKQSYMNSFERILGGMVTQQFSAKRPARPELEIASKFANWEMKVRGNMSKSYEGRLWNAYPTELVGNWSLVESDDASLLSSIAIFPGREKTRQIVLQPAGEVKIDGMCPLRAATQQQPKLDSVEGLNWRLNPGPTHLDTCYIRVRIVEESGERNVGFVGYIDRGQRIESRFSNRPIRMSGVVVDTLSEKVDDVAIGSKKFKDDVVDVIGRFVMEKSLDE